MTAVPTKPAIVARPPAPVAPPKNGNGSAPAAPASTTSTSPASAPLASAARPATLAIAYVNAEGFVCTLTLEAATGTAAIAAERQASTALVAAGARPQGAPSASPATGQADEPAPVCAIHGTPMTRVSNARGSFWSCHERIADGTFCPYRPPRK